ncbi:hypothetical protein QO5_2700 [Clostridioides difficile F253]|nr:hypothetical protein QO5_2700 [Clostridioides difficile F253]
MKLYSVVVVVPSLGTVTIEDAILCLSAIPVHGLPAEQAAPQKSHI